ncbi:ABC transporter ATP-binding protein/permease [Pelomonas sp. KK5]|uniref:ABC transporter ATP-binding protein/permease n=1 Tax=Pelomonas sp. KK5 TaxID=1855730 RepID=UPI00097C640E|nr:ABC transporter ATP-binding protein/permease [Pelomonas sp. KK5]
MQARASRGHVVFELASCLLASPQRASMLAMLPLYGGLLGAQQWFGIQLAQWTGRMMDALVQRDAAAFREVVPMLFGVVTVLLLASGTGMYINLLLKMRARTALTKPWLRRWLDGGEVYRLERERLIDNPDQRIAEDLNLIVDKTLALLLGGVSALAGVWLLSAQLWQRGGALAYQVAGHAGSIAGHLFWIAVLYSVLDLLLTRLIARPQIGLNVRQQHVEADFRFGLVQVREHAEQIAFHRGGAMEVERLRQCFQLVRGNWYRLIAFQAGFNVFSTAAGLVSGLLMYFVLGPRVLSGAMTIGELVTLSSLFGQALGSLNWLAGAWKQIVEWLAVLRRLDEMKRAMAQPSTSGIALDEAKGLSLHDLQLSLPDGQPLLTVGDLRIAAGQRWLLRGPSGLGKSTLLRAIAGLWPHGVGRIEVPPAGRVMFMPQKSYLPWDRLKAVLAYPRSAQDYPDDACRRALVECCLPQLADHLDDVDRWSMRLSLGEQQRLAFARALLARPAFLFLDESTSALDERTEAHLYRLLLDRLPLAALVSVAHRPSLESFHTHGLNLSATRPAQVVPLGAST